MARKIKYKGGYKYQLVEEYIAPRLKYFRDFDRQIIRTDYIILTPQGGLIIRKGYAWDGPSGLAIHSKNFMVGSLIHDALYQLMMMGFLDSNIYRESADKLLREICRQHGMSAFRAWYVYRTVRIFGEKYAKAEPKKILVAP